ncbi:uncharacterized protein LOC121990876 [Zingiber officinale]|uniref:uncharacterized protein LOC121990876 n=1 Tax=Zingiber officinale TaxID=94328 RepID=UPI001C4D5FE3|nr:uncharacterized protein LOC121990876 [Zingiber officinale]
MDKIFWEQIGHNVKVDVDDILIKSPLAVNLIQDVEETCRTLQQYGLKLNPLKYRAAPFFKVLRKASKFQWDEECTRAFEELKKYLETLPSLFKPVVGEPLWVYLSATPEAVGVVLVKEHDNVQRPVYFFSHLLKGDVSRYTAVEKLVYGLGSGVGVLVISPQGDILQLAVRLNFRATNNEAEYEVLLAGLQAARHVGAARVIIYLDSQLVTQQVTSNFMINCDKLQVYREVYERMKEEFTEVIVTKIPRSENERVDELAKIVSSLTTWVLDRSTAQTFLIAQIDLQNNREATIDWRTPMINYLRQGILPTDPEESRLIRKQVHAYVMIRDQLYKRSFSRPLLKCLGVEEADQALREIHLGCCGNHVGGRTLSRKVLLAGYFWPTLQRDAHKLANTYLSCQKHQNLTHRPTTLLRTSIVSCPFDQWGMDIVGSFSMAPDLVFLTSWCLTMEGNFKDKESRPGVKLDHVGSNWVEELPSILWAYRTTPRESTGLTPFHLVYDNEAVVPIEIGVPPVRKTLYDEGNIERRLAELDLISETRDRTAARLEAYRQRMR